MKSTAPPRGGRARAALRSLGLAGLVLLAPVLMAPMSPPCPACEVAIETVKLAPRGEYTFDLEVPAGERADVIMRPDAGNPDLHCRAASDGYECRPGKPGRSEEVCSAQPAVATRYQCMVRAGRSAARFTVQIARSDGGCGMPGSEKHCAPHCTCGYQAGDCDTTSDCAAGLTCVDHVGARFGFGATVDVCL